MKNNNLSTRAFVRFGGKFGTRRFGVEHLNDVLESDEDADDFWRVDCWCQEVRCRVISDAFVNVAGTDSFRF